jgi:hypothetical protein
MFNLYLPVQEPKLDVTLWQNLLTFAFSGIDLVLLAQASCLDFILFMNLVDFSIALLAFASNF